MKPSAHWWYKSVADGTISRCLDKWIGPMSADLYCAKAARFCLPGRAPAHVTLLAVPLLLFLATSKAAQIPNGESRNPEAHPAPVHSQVVRYEGRTENVQVPVVMEPWSATAVPTVPPQRRIVRFVGRFPGFEASKRRANLLKGATVATRTLSQGAPPLDIQCALKPKRHL